MTTQDTGTAPPDAGTSQQPADATTVLTAAAPAADSTSTSTPPADGSTPPAKATSDAPAPKQDDKPADDGTKKADDKPADDKPIVYEFKAPEGIELAKEDVDAFTVIAQELKLPADAAQKVVDLAVKREQQRMTAHVDQVKAWGEQITADKELGKPENVATAVHAINQFGSPELKALLNSSGLGNHPELVRFAYRVGRAISEDGVHVGRGDAPAATDAAKKLYPNQA